MYCLLQAVQCEQKHIKKEVWLEKIKLLAYMQNKVWQKKQYYHLHTTQWVKHNGGNDMSLYVMMILSGR